MNITDIFIEHAAVLFVDGLAASFYYLPIHKNLVCLSTSGGAAVCSFGLAINRAYTDEGGEKKEDVTFIDRHSFPSFMW